jgi:hypothetical protein
MSPGSSITSGCREERIAAEIASTSPDYTDWRLLEARWPGVDIIVGASGARRRVNLPESIVKIRFWLPGRFVVAESETIPKHAVRPTSSYSAGIAAIRSSPILLN